METQNKDKKEKRARSLANLIPAKKGEVRNPNGRPKNNQCITALIRKELDNKHLGGKITSKEMMVNMLVSIACQGNLKAMEMILNYCEGKPRERVEITGKEGQPVEARIFVINEKAKEITQKILAGEGT